MKIPENIVDIVLKVDNNLIEQGIEPHKRIFHAEIEVLKIIAPNSCVPLGDTSLSKIIQEIYHEIYGSRNLVGPPMHVGALMFKDIFFRLVIPIPLGYQVSVSADDLVKYNLVEGITENQKKAFFSNEMEYSRLNDQFIDLADFIYGLDDVSGIGTINKTTLEFWKLAKQQLEAAAAIASGSFDKNAIFQNCFFAIELLMKGALVEKDTGLRQLTRMDLDEKLKKKYGHNLVKVANKLAILLPNLNSNLLLPIVETYPKLEERRYNAKEHTRFEIGHFLMNAQFIGGEILRQFSTRNIRAGEQGASGLSTRVFPSIPT